jgi:hypothetical protein
VYTSVPVRVTVAGIVRTTREVKAAPAMPDCIKTNATAIVIDNSFLIIFFTSLHFRFKNLLVNKLK